MRPFPLLPSPFALLALLALAGCCQQPGPTPPAYYYPQPYRANPYQNVPPVDLPPALRHPNYGQQGSCLHAAVQDLLAWQGLDAEAARWRSEHSGGAVVPTNWRDRSGNPTPSVVAIARSHGLAVAWTSAGDERFLDWCSATRRGAAIHWIGTDARGRSLPGTHAVTFCGFVRDAALIIDNNHPEAVVRLPRDPFLAAWRASGGAAVTVLATPAPPRPWI